MKKTIKETKKEKSNSIENLNKLKHDCISLEWLKNRKIQYLLIILIGVLISIPFLWLQIKTTDDGWLHLLRLIGVSNSFENSTFPLVLPYFCNNWGYSMTAFYPPIVTYIPYILGLISGSFANGLKLFATIATIVSGIFM